MKRIKMSAYRRGILIWCCFLAIIFLCLPVSAQTIIDDWSAVKTPAAPELKSVTIDPKGTALLLLDFNKQTCNAERRPRCIASIPKVKKLLADARAKGVFEIGRASCRERV